MHEALDLTPALYKQALIRIPVILALEKEAGRSEVQNHPCLGSDFETSLRYMKLPQKTKYQNQTRTIYSPNFKEMRVLFKNVNNSLTLQTYFWFLVFRSNISRNTLSYITSSPILNFKTPNKTKLSTNLCFSINDVTKYCYEKLSNMVALNVFVFSLRVATPMVCLSGFLFSFI